MACKLCKARGDAHFGWCVSVGGPGYPPSRAPKVADTAQAPPRAPRLQLVPPRPSIVPGVNVVNTRTPQENADRARRNELIWTAVSGDVDWTRIDVEATAVQLLDSCQRGLPAAIPFGYRPDVLALQGLDLEQCDTAVRRPQRVEIRPETSKKGYPILGFHRGDVTVILGMRFPTKPAVIAAYWTSLLAADTYRRPEQAGGGGARKAGGLPTTVKALVKRLSDAGAVVDDGWQCEPAASVSYRGQELGKVCTGPATAKAQVQQDWQRTVRKMQAIDRREAAAG